MTKDQIAVMTERASEVAAAREDDGCQLSRPVKKTGLNETFDGEFILW